MILFSIALLLIAVSIHEYAHGWVAYKLGDPTAKYAGRLTLNPLSHIDPIGTIFLPLMLVVMGYPPFGWAKPVPVNFSLLRRPKQDMVWVSVAGITANFLLAIMFAVLIKISPFTVDSYGRAFLTYGILINLILAVFNAIPIPPLDGSKIVLRFLPQELVHSYMQLERFGFLILIGLLWIGLLDKVIWPVVMFLARVLGVVL